MRELTVKEFRVINYLADAWDSFLMLPVLHKDDENEFRTAIHALQEKVLARPAVEQNRKVT
jgi:hypothetical protein